MENYRYQTALNPRHGITALPPQTRQNLRLHCPFHNDKTHSLQVYYKTHTAYCFSSNCKTHGKSMDVIDFVMYKGSCTKAEAIEKAITMSGSELNEPIEAATIKSIIAKEQFLQNMFQQEKTIFWRDFRRDSSKSIFSLLDFVKSKKGIEAAFTPYFYSYYLNFIEYYSAGF